MSYEQGYADGVNAASRFIKAIAEDIKEVEDKETEEVVYLRQLSDAVKEVLQHG